MHGMCHAYLPTTAEMVAPDWRPPSPWMLGPAIAANAARRGSPARPPLGAKQPGWGCWEEERRLAGPGLGSMEHNVALAKVEGRPTPCLAALSTTTAGAGGEWARKRRSPRGPSDERPRPTTLALLLITIIIGRRV